MASPDNHGEGEQATRPERIRAALRCWLPHILVIAVALLVALAIYLPLVHTLLDYEDGEWVRAAFPLYRSRVIQFILMNNLLLPLLDHRVEGFYLFGALLHLGCALQIYAFLIVYNKRVRTTLRGVWWPSWAGASLGALAFLVYESGNLVFLSALSYQLFCFFGLLALILALEYLGRGKAWLWIASLGATALALLSHSYALGLPLMIGGLELVWRRSRVLGPARWNITWRYLLHLLPPWFFINQFGEGLLAKRLSGGRILRHLFDPELLQVDALHFINYLQISAVTFARNIPGLWPGENPPLPETALYWSPGRLAAGATLALLVTAGMVTLVLRRRGGLGVMAALFVALWSGLTFHQTLFIGYDEEQGWRMYHNIAGLCLLLGFGLSQVLGALLKGRSVALQRVAMSGVLLAATAWVFVNQPRYLDTAGALLSGDLRLKNDYSWDPHARCKQLTSVTREEVADLVNQGADLSCRDLSYFDLSSLDLRKARLRGSDLTGVNLRGVWLEGADLRQAGLSFASAEMAHLKGADLRGTNLTGANFNNVDLTGARMDGVIMVGTFRYNIAMEGKTPEQVQELIDRKSWRRKR